MRSLKNKLLLGTAICFISCQNPTMPEITNTTEQTIEIVKEYIEQIEEVKETEETETPEEIPIEDIPIVRNDLSCNFVFENYIVGSNFNYSGTIRNNTKELIKITNSDKKSLGVVLSRNELEVFNKFFEENLIIEIKENGYIFAEHKDNNLKIKISNCYVEYAGKKYDVASPLTYSKNLSVASYKFKDLGLYNAELQIKYEVSGKEYLSKFKSEEIEVE